MLKFYYLSGSCALVPHTALIWAGADFEAVKMERDALKSPEYLAINPNGNVPLLTDGDWTLSQNVAIVEYVNALYPQAKIFGLGDAKSQAKARQWLSFANSDIHGKFGLVFGAARLLPDADEATQNAVKQAGMKAVLDLYVRADKALAEQDYLAGNEITIADVYVYVTVRWAKALGMDLSGLPNLQAHFERVSQNNGVQSALKAQGVEA